MAEDQEISSTFLSAFSSENRYSIDSLSAEADGGDEELYEKIEAPKYVDFTAPDHYRSDDRYWFCLRVGCDQKHEEEMDSEEIYKKFVLRVMAARSPNVRLWKTLDRNASRTPVKCPLSAPPKPSKPRLSRMLISSISKKTINDKKRVMKPLLKSATTPVTKIKPVAAKHLTTPRNKKIISDHKLFRSVQHPKSIDVEVEKSRIVAKALVFRSPKKAIKVKTSVELRTPISKLCQGMNKLEISSQRKRHLGYSSKPSKILSNSSLRKLSSRRVQGKPEEPLCSQTCTHIETKSGRSIKTKIKRLSQQREVSMKFSGSDDTSSCLRNSRDIKKQLSKNVNEEIGLQVSSLKEACGFSTEQPPTHDSDLVSPDDLRRNVKWLDIERSDNSRSQAADTQVNNSRLQPTNRQEKDGNDGNENIVSESSRESINHLTANKTSERERNEHEFMDGDDKENASASDRNRIQNKSLKQNGIKIFGMHDKCGRVQKKLTQAHNKNLKEDSSGPVMKLKKPKATNPKPFRLRTDERGILKEATSERRADPLAPQSGTATGGKLQRKQGNDIQKGSMITGLRTPKGQKRLKAAAAYVTPESNRHQERKLMCNAMQRLEKFRKITSPLSKHSVRPQGFISTKQEMTSYLIPGQKLDVIHEISPEVVSEPRRAGKPARNAPPIDAAAAVGAASWSSSRGRQIITVAMEPKFPSIYVPRSCTKKIK